MTAYVLEIDNEWVYLEIDRQIKFKARYHVKKGSRFPAPGSNVILTFVNNGSRQAKRIPGIYSERPPLVELAVS